jgi:sRNA-binding carbon storage regulator CsrA
MTILTRGINDSITIGEHLTVTLTDIDQAGVRLMIDGELIGGPDDGMTIRERRELGVNGEVRIGSLITLTVTDISAQKAKIGVVAPKHIVVDKKEKLDKKKSGSDGN